MRELTALPNANVAAYQPAFSPDGRTLAVSLPGAVRVWDVPSGRVLRDLEVSGVTRLEVSPAGRALVVSTFNHSVFLFDLADGTRTAGPELAGVRLGEFAFAAFLDGGRTLAVYTDEQLALVPLEEDGLRPSGPARTWPVPAGEVNSLAVAANARLLAGGRAVPSAGKDPGGGSSICSGPTGRPCRRWRGRSRPTSSGWPFRPTAPCWPGPRRRTRSRGWCSGRSTPAGYGTTSAGPGTSGTWPSRPTAGCWPRRWATAACRSGT